jgi:pimeloyl-ACP methyl ester carboxylesterase
MQRFNTYGRLGQIVAPTLVVTGDADRLVPPANSHLLAARIPGAELEILAGAGHGFFWERSTEVIHLLGDFCLSS